MNPPPPPVPEPQRKFDARGFALAILSTGLATFIGWLLFHGPFEPDPSRKPRISEVNVLMLYLLAVVWVATRSSRGATILASILAVAAFGVGAFTSLEEQVRRNMEMFERAFAMFAPFARRESAAAESASEAEKGAGKSGDIDDLKRQLDEMKRKVDRLTEKGPARQ